MTEENFLRTNFDALTGGQKQLLSKAEKALEFSYNPYSKFAVGAALMMQKPDGSRGVVTGCNIENASYSLTLCAEATALATAHSMGLFAQGAHLVAIAIIGKLASHPEFDIRSFVNTPQDPDSKVITPCGACRQLIREAANHSGHAASNVEIIMSSSDKEIVFVSTINDLLPLSFTAKSFTNT